MRDRNKHSRAAVLFVALLIMFYAFYPTIAQPTAIARAEPEQQSAMPAQSVTSIGQVLNADGTLNIASDFNGNLDPNGYTMQTGPNGEPRFVPKSGNDKKKPSDPPLDAPIGSYVWDSRFNSIGVNINGKINAVAVNGANVYVGGDFTVAGTATANNVAYWNGSQWSALSSGVDGPVYAMVYTGGNLYAGGDFTHAGGQTAHNIARWDGSAWHDMVTGTNDPVTALAVSGTNIYAGGDFTAAGIVFAHHIARWDGITWYPVGGGVTGYHVYAIAITGSDIYVGGNFQSAGTVDVSNLARWDGTTWHDVNGGIGGTVYALAIFGTDLYVGGDFYYVNGVSGFHNIARYDMNSTLWFPLNYGVNGPVRSLVHSTIGYGLYAGGEFNMVGPNGAEISANGVAMWSTSGGGWSPLGISSSNGVSGSVFALGMTANGYLFAGGSFSHTGTLYNGGVVANNIARWYGNAWTALGTGLGVTGHDSLLSAVLAYTDGGTVNVVVGGRFDSIGGIPAKNIARWNGTSWSTFGSGANNGISGLVFALARGPGNEIYVGGYFSRAGSITANNVARWTNATGWSNMGGGLTNPGHYADVRALAYNNYDTNLYVGGTFAQAGPNVSANNIARWSGSTWSKLQQGTTSNNGVNGEVNAIAIRDSDHKVYVGGDFTSAGGQSVGNIARWGINGSIYLWSSLGTANGAIEALLFVNDELYAGGQFVSMSPGGTANHIARFNFISGSWFPLGSGQSNGVDGIVWALAANGSTIYAGGDFTTAGGIVTNHIARWGGSSWSALAGGVTSPYPYYHVIGLATEGTTLYVAGSYGQLGTKPSSNFGRYYYVPPPPLP